MAKESEVVASSTLPAVRVEGVHWCGNGHTAAQRPVYQRHQENVSSVRVWSTLFVLSLIFCHVLDVSCKHIYLFVSILRPPKCAVAY